MPAATDFLPSTIELIRSRRRSVELRLEEGRLRARIPRRIGRGELERILPELRRRLRDDLARKRVFDEDRLLQLARKIARSRLRDLKLPPFSVAFSKRQRSRWGSCTFDPHQESGSIRISEALRGHPVWVVEHILLHELIHLKVPNHGARFAELMQRSARPERAEGYLEAMESLSVLGKVPRDAQELLGKLEAAVSTPVPDRGLGHHAVTMSEPETLPLFAPLSQAAGSAERRNALTKHD